MTGVAVKVIGVPAQIVLPGASDAILTLTGKSGSTVTVALPFIVTVQLLAEFVASIVYVPAPVILLKLIATPVPATGEPTGVPPFFN